ncbi:MAG TPA: antitoxin Xre/MbcA/ParS toxin-binding domain-containing protein [Chitinophagaceae bacterium]|nr:antitoxin Xre/MbcA/ParS toxin-binding domain-containing protein [Chitinophagaceae bacterium]
MSYIWEEMKKNRGKIKKYKIADVPLPLAEEAAIQYKSLGIILGGNKTIKKEIGGDFDLISLTREGIKKSTLKSLAGYLGISMEVMSRLLHTSHRNIQRKHEEEILDTLKTEKVLELAAFAQRGIEVIGSRAGFIEWLHSPLVSLGNKTPVDYLDTSFGIQMVTKILGRLEQGVYS